MVCYTVVHSRVGTGGPGHGGRQRVVSRMHAWAMSAVLRALVFAIETSVIRCVCPDSQWDKQTVFEDPRQNLVYIRLADLIICFVRRYTKQPFEITLAFVLAV